VILHNNMSSLRMILSAMNYGLFERVSSVQVSEMQAVLASILSDGRLPRTLP
jgi:hypothetical protein